MDKRPTIAISTRQEPPSGYFLLPQYVVAQSYVHSVWNAGGVPVLLPPVFGEQQVERLLARFDGLVLSGGGDIAAEKYGAVESTLLEKVDPARDRAELALARFALRTEKPIMAICRGIQILNVATGGTLYADITSQIPGALTHRPVEGEPLDTSAHPVHLESGSRLATIMDAELVTTNSFHHQAAWEVGEGLIVTARASDGVIEGLEHQDHPFCVGVQWHPEVKFGSQDGMERLFQALVEAA